MPLGSLHGKAVRTVESLANGGQLHPVQAAMVACSGSQCGYCTPGVVMSLFEAYHRDDLDDQARLDDQLAGNLCRCTGYRPIHTAAEQIAGIGAHDIVVDPPPISAALHYVHGDQVFVAPRDLTGLWAALRNHPSARVIAGGTDLGLEITLQHRRFPALIGLDGIDELRRLEARAGLLLVGAGVRLSDLEAFARRHLPVIADMLTVFGSRQIKNRATVGGNLCHASPVGDLAPIMLALGARLHLRSAAAARIVDASEFFVDYRRTCLGPGEILEHVEIPRPTASDRVAAYKVSKRRELDISTVNFAGQIRVDDRGDVVEARIAFGGLDKVPRRCARLETALRGQPWTTATVEAVVSTIAADFRPIDDVRGSAAYRLRVAQNLLRRFVIEHPAAAIVSSMRSTRPMP